MPEPALPRFGPWIAVEQAGEGAFGITWRCVHEANPSHVAAVKVLRAEVERQPSYRARFLAERDLLRTLGSRPHPHLAAYEGCDPDPSPRWIATEFIASRDLEGCLDDGRHTHPYPLGSSPHDRYALALLIGRAVASAAAFSHAQGIVHRDLKPGNILLGDNGRVVVIDFGIGRDARIDRLTSLQTPSPHTAAFAAPEVLAGERIDDAWLARLDVYGLGVVLHEILSGEVASLPYIVDSEGHTSARPRTAPLLIPDRFPERLDQLVQQMTAIEAWERPDMAAVHARLHDLPDRLEPGADGEQSNRQPRRKTAPATRPPDISDDPADRDTWRPDPPPWKPEAPAMRAEFFQPDRPLPSIPTEFEPPPPPPPPPRRRPFPWTRLLGAAALTVAATLAFLNRPTTCGDGRVGGEETCDDGNRADGDGCDFLCRAEHTERCGDGKLDPGEGCDDGNRAPDDGCTSDCRVEDHARCGDGERTPPEACDDGNLVPGDGCDARCKVEGLFPPSSDAQLTAWARAADRAGWQQLFEHAAAEPNWLLGFSPEALRGLVAAQHRAAPELVSKGGTVAAIAPLLSELPGSLSCDEARSWLAWTSLAVETDPTVGAFYQRWCTICQGRRPELALDARACKRRAADGFVFTEGRCVHADNLPYLRGCALGD